MKFSNKTKIGFILFFCFGIAFCCFGCKKSDPAENLSRFLLTDGYRAEIDFSIEKDGLSDLDGALSVKKYEKTVLEFSSPEEFSLLTVESNSLSEAQTLIFSYYGMRAPLPDGAMSKINLLLLAFSDEAGQKIRYCNSKPSDSDNKDLALCSALLDGGENITFVFDKTTGFPVTCSVQKEALLAKIEFKQIIPPDMNAAEQ